MKRSSWLGLLGALLVCSLAGVLVVAVLAINAIWFKPFFINVFFERVFMELVLDDPPLLGDHAAIDTTGGEIAVAASCAAHETLVAG